MLVTHSWTKLASSVNEKMLGYIFDATLPTYSGGMASLFAGLSMVSVVEAAFWLYRLLKGMIAMALKGRRVQDAKESLESEGRDPDMMT